MKIIATSAQDTSSDVAALSFERWINKTVPRFLRVEIFIEFPVPFLFRVVKQMYAQHLPQYHLYDTCPPYKVSSDRSPRRGSIFFGTLAKLTVYKYPTQGTGREFAFLTDAVQPSETMPGYVYYYSRWSDPGETCRYIGPLSGRSVFFQCTTKISR